MKKRLCKLLAVLLALQACAGCAKGTDEQQAPDEASTVTLIHNMNEDSAIRWLDACAEKFNEGNSDIEIEIEVLSSDDYTTILRNKIAGDDIPDIFMVEDIRRNMEFVDAGLCEELSQYSWLEENVKETALKAVVMEDGSIYNLPMTENCFQVTYNKDLFEAAGIQEVPKTWSEFLSVCESLKNSGADPIAAGFQEPWVLYCDEMCDSIVTTVRNDADNRLDLAAGTTTWVENKGHFSEVLTRLRERMPYTNSDPFGTDWSSALNMLASGKAAMLLNGSYTMASVKEINPDCNLGIFPLPVTEDPDEALLPIHASASGWCVYKDSEEKDAALKFVEFLSTSEAGTLMQNIKGEISPNKDSEVDEDSDLYEIMNYIEEGNVFDYTGYSELFISDELEGILTDVETEFLMDESMSVEQALETLDERFSAALSANK